MTDLAVPGLIVEALGTMSSRSLAMTGVLR